MFSDVTLLSILANRWALLILRFGPILLSGLFVRFQMYCA